MSRYIVNRLIHSLVIVWGVLTLTFLILHLAPGDPTSLYVRPDIDPETIETIRRQMGLDLPVWKQYFLWIGEFLKGNFGMSLVHNRPVRDILFETIPNTLQLTAVVFVLQFLLGLIFGIITALKRNSKIDLSISSILLFLYSVPGFWLALMLVMIFSLHLGWLPSSHMSSLHIDGGIWLQLADRLRHLVLPVTVLTMPFAAYTARFVRGSLSDVLVEDYIRTAIAYGINRRQVIFKYALKNALLPVATLMGMYLPFLLGGAVITEYIFAWPGMGRLTINAIFAHDFPIILASSFLAALAVVIGNMLSDLLYATIDPRIRLVK